MQICQIYYVYTTVILHLCTPNTHCIFALFICTHHITVWLIHRWTELRARRVLMKEQASGALGGDFANTADRLRLKDFVSGVQCCVVIIC